MDQILPNFDPLHPSRGQFWTFYMIPTLCQATKRELSTDPLPPLFVHVVIEWPLSSMGVQLVLSPIESPSMYYLCIAQGIDDLRK